jgi:two-component system phosphate regulon sensor histidine kinase PhoR
MKKIFPLIIVLITLSLIGIIIIQVQWFSNLMLVQQEKFFFKLDRAMIKVANDLGKQSTSSPMMHLHRRPDNKLIPDNFPINPYRPSTVADHYTDYEIYDKLRNAFNDEGLKYLSFEFAITGGADELNVELSSKNFLHAYLDTVNYKPQMTPISTDNASQFDTIVPYEHLVIVVTDVKTQVWRALAWMLAGSVFFTIIIITAFYLTVKTMLNQRKLSLIKSDFINNMTHELKTPLATISLAIDAVRNEKVQNDAEKMQYFSGIIKEENKRMNKHVETILQAGLMEKQDLKMNMTRLHVNDIIRNVANNFKLQLQDKKGIINLKLNAANDVIIGDEVHFTNMINNLVDNAVKYSKDNLVIMVATHSTQKNLVIRVEDNGIGMSKETVKRIFEKFYRAHTGNIHNVKGFGLGMSYVKTVIDVHKGKIKVESVLGKGSDFIIDLPLAKDK